MAFTNAAWNAETTTAAKLAKLNLYIAEIEAACDSGSGGGLSFTRPSATMLSNLYTQRDRLQREADRLANGPVSTAALRL